MKQRRVVFSPEARDDLRKLLDWIASKAGEEVALGYVERIETFCLNFDLASQRGHLRDDIRPEIRIVGFERRLTIAYFVDDEQVTFLHIFYGGQDWKASF